MTRLRLFSLLLAALMGGLLATAEMQAQSASAPVDPVQANPAQADPVRGNSVPINAAPVNPAPASSSAAEHAAATSPSQPLVYDPLLDLPPLPHNKVSLTGGTLSNVDDVQNRLTIQPFGGKQKMHLNFDTRTRIYSDGRAASESDLKSGQRVYVDTMLNGTRVFAKSIWIQSTAATGDARGQVIGFDAERKTLSIRDEVSAQAIEFRIAPDAVFRDGDRTASAADLSAGSLVSLSFGPKQGHSGVVHEVTVLARPGAVFTFFGKITYLDLSKKLVAISNQSDNKSYDLSVETIPTATLQSLREGANAAISAVFDGSHYVAQKIELVQAANTPQQ